MRLRELWVDWDFVKRLRDTVTVKLLIEGIVTREDAQMDVEHGGRPGGLQSRRPLRGTFAPDDRKPTGSAGRRRRKSSGHCGWRNSPGNRHFQGDGTRGDCDWHRPASFLGTCAFGLPGVESVLEILRRELKTIVRQAGTTSLEKITKTYVIGSWR
jgi:hypothetical protein